MIDKNKIQAEKNKIANMTKEQKISYYKTYYMWPSIVLVIGIILLIWFISDLFFKPEPVSMGVAFGVELTEEQKFELTEGYLEYYGYDKKKSSAHVATDNMFEGTAQQMDAYSNIMALYAQIAAGEINYMILDENMMHKMEDGGIYSDLSEILTEDYLEKYEQMDAVIELEDPDTGIYKGALDLRKIGFLNSDQEGYLIFTIALPTQDYSMKLLDYLVNIS